MNKKYNFLIFQIIFFIFFVSTIVYSLEEESLFCKGVYWSNNKVEYSEWHIIKGTPKYKINFIINSIDIKVIHYAGIKWKPIDYIKDDYKSKNKIEIDAINKYKKIVKKYISIIEKILK